ncbi:uncharacterized protein LOC132643729 [Lycium barbarum]|uniref:uncharacterized protein LOC132643729 n=1 Tax=Lycium barbarum TaxID=112863 RepID=UPI00293E8C99|nr:uncharacterized protein LOC132643729 [Lycium barbarum]
MLRKIFAAKNIFAQDQMLAEHIGMSIKTLYLHLIGDRPRMPWKCMMISNGAKPKALLSLWLQIQDRLMTTDRLVGWGINVDPYCKLCTNQLETRAHLFVHYEYSKKVWTRLLKWLQILSLAATTWESHLQWIITKAKGKSKAAQLFRMAYAEFVHAVWLERNQKTFEDRKRDWTVLAREIAYICNVRAPLGLRTRLQ